MGTDLCAQMNTAVLLVAIFPPRVSQLQHDLPNISVPTPLGDLWGRTGSWGKDKFAFWIIALLQDASTFHFCLAGRIYKWTYKIELQFLSFIIQKTTGDVNFCTAQNIRPT